MHRFDNSAILPLTAVMVSSFIALSILVFNISNNNLSKADQEHEYAFLIGQGCDNIAFSRLNYYFLTNQTDKFFKEINDTQNSCKDVVDTINKYSQTLKNLSSVQKQTSFLFYLMAVLAFVSLIFRVLDIINVKKRGWVLDISNYTFLLSLIILLFTFIMLGNLLFTT